MTDDSFGNGVNMSKNEPSAKPVRCTSARFLKRGFQVSVSVPFILQVVLRKKKFGFIKVTGISLIAMSLLH